jgi:hypothetical protein
VSLSAAVRRRLDRVDDACADLNPVLLFVALGLVLNLCLFLGADPEAMRRALLGMRMMGYEIIVE